MLLYTEANTQERGCCCTEYDYRSDVVVGTRQGEVTLHISTHGMPMDSLVSFLLVDSQPFVLLVFQDFISPLPSAYNISTTYVGYAKKPQKTMFKRVCL